jgi:hypothetical protein
VFYDVEHFLFTAQGQPELQRKQNRFGHDTGTWRVKRIFLPVSVPEKSHPQLARLSCLGLGLDCAVPEGLDGPGIIAIEGRERVVVLIEDQKRLLEHNLGDTLSARRGGKGPVVDVVGGDFARGIPTRCASRASSAERLDHLVEIDLSRLVGALARRTCGSSAKGGGRAAAALLPEGRHGQVLASYVLEDHLDLNVKRSSIDLVLSGCVDLGFGQAVILPAIREVAPDLIFFKRENVRREGGAE